MKRARRRSTASLRIAVRALPGVISASLAFNVPMGYPSKAGSIYVEGHLPGRNQQSPSISHNSIDPAYFKTMRVPLLEGRTFTDSDNETAPPVAIVNQAMAKKLWPNEDAIGKRFSLKTGRGPFIEVAGMAHDGQYYLYLPKAGLPSIFRRPRTIRPSGRCNFAARFHPSLCYQRCKRKFAVWPPIYRFSETEAGDRHQPNRPSDLCGGRNPFSRRNTACVLDAGAPGAACRSPGCATPRMIPLCASLKALTCLSKIGRASCRERV